MSLWAKTQQLPSDIFQQVNNLYTPELFPIEVRHYLAQWIEEQNWNEIEPDNPSFLQPARNFVEQMIVKMTEISNRSDLDFVQQLQIQKYIETFKVRYLASPLELIKVIKHCLSAELRLVHQAESGVVVGGVDPNPNLWIVQKLDELRRATQQTSGELRQLEQEQEAFWLQLNEYNRLNAAIAAQLAQATESQRPEMERRFNRQKETHETNLKAKAGKLVSDRMTLTEKYKEVVAGLQQVQSRVLDVDLIQWKREQQLAGNGAMFNNNLDIIQQWCEGLADLIWTTRQQVKELELLLNKLTLQAAVDGPEIVTQLKGQITQLLSSLVTSTFVIEKQPPQVMKTNTRFTATVRLLVGGKLNVHMTPPQVKVNILSDTQANSLLRSEQAAKTGDSSGDILNNSGTMEYIAATRQLVVNFRNMQLRKIKRAEKKGTESVMDEKFSLLFLSQFTIGAGELEFQVWTLSLPVVVIVHGNQEPHAWATVSWDNAFAEPGRTCFVVPDRVPWPQVADMLNTKFQSACGRQLTEDNLKFLAGKAFRNHNVADYSQLLLNWNAFAKEPLPDRNFTFWEWFYGILKLTREHLKNLWNDGLIMGFVGKAQATDMLMKQPVCTFLLRYSDSELGGISIAAFKAETAQGGGPGVDHLLPWTSKDFGIRSLADRLNDLGNLTFLYPNVPKDQAFAKYCSPNEAQPSNTGYVKPLLVTHVPGWSAGGFGSEGSYPNTPQYQYPQSPPDPHRDTPSSVLSVGSESAGPSQFALDPELDLTLFEADDLQMDFTNLNLAPFLASVDPNQFGI